MRPAPVLRIAASASRAARAATKAKPSASGAGSSGSATSAPRTRQERKRSIVRMFEKTDVRVGEVSEPRALSHYYNTLAPDLLYLTYRHRFNPKVAEVPERDPTNPYAVHQAPLAPRGGYVPNAKPTNDETLVKLEKIVLHTYMRETKSNKQLIYSAMSLFRQLSGESFQGGGWEASKGVQVHRTTKKATTFNMPQNIPSSVTVEIHGAKMYDFISTLVECVLPRMRDFTGVTMPVPSASIKSPSAMSGVVSFGLPPAAMALFPQVEVNFDSYPHEHGFNINFVTNAKGPDAQNKARSLVSGFRIPFVRK